MAAQRVTDELMRRIHEAWVGNNNRWMDLLRKTRWHIKGLEGLDYEHSYLVTSNHQSWVDIMVLQYVLQQMTQVLMQRLQMPVICLARLAGQYAKPRSSDSETLGHRIQCM